MKNKINLFSICFFLFFIIVLLFVFHIYSYKNKESYTNNGLDVYDNLAFIGISRGDGNSNQNDINWDDKIGFGGRWGNETAKKFLALQSTINPSYIFNVNLIQKYVTKDEVEQFLSNGGTWYWSNDTKTQYLLYMNRHSLFKNWVSPYFNISELQSIYPEKAVKILLQIHKNVVRNKITPFDNEEHYLYEGVDKNGSGIFTFGVNSGLLVSDCNTCYGFV
jgi:hypothetical protein